MVKFKLHSLTVGEELDINIEEFVVADSWFSEGMVFLLTHEIIEEEEENDKESNIQ